MRVLYLSPWFPYPLDTGSRTRAYFLVRALARKHRVTLVSLDPQGWAPPQKDALEPFCDQALLVAKDPFRRSWLRTKTRFLSLRPIVDEPFPEVLQLVKQLHADKPFDVVIAGTTVTAAYALALPNVVRILEEHNSNTRWMRERISPRAPCLHRLRYWISWYKTMRYESRLFRRFDLVSMVSELDAKTSRNLVEGSIPRVVVFPNGVDCVALHPRRLEPLPETLVFSGALTYHANYEAIAFFLREVYPLICAVDPAVRLRITGATTNVDLGGLLLDPSVTLTGYVEDVYTEIANAKVSVAPILTGGGTRLKVLEAMALGTAVVSTSKGCEGIDASHGEHLLLADTPTLFADSVISIIRDVELRMRLVTRARALVAQTYDWEQIGQRFVANIENVVAALCRR